MQASAEQAISLLGEARVLRDGGFFDAEHARSNFLQRKGTPLWGTCMAPEKAEDIANHLKDGCGIRRTARLTNASKDGVTSIAIRLGLHAHAMHDKYVKDVEVKLLSGCISFTIELHLGMI